MGWFWIAEKFLGQVTQQIHFGFHFHWSCKEMLQADTEDGGKPCWVEFQHSHPVWIPTFPFQQELPHHSPQELSRVALALDELPHSRPGQEVDGTNLPWFKGWADLQDGLWAVRLLWDIFCSALTLPKTLSAAPGNLGQVTTSERGDEEKRCHPFLCVK